MRFLLALLLVAACRADAIMTYRQPVVAIVDTSETKESPARAYAVLPFPAPLFPRDLYLAQIEGTVVVRVVVGKDGVVKNVAAIKSSRKEFEKPALEAVMRWRFFEVRDPRVKEPSGATVDCTIRFSLPDEDEEEPNRALEPTLGLSRLMLRMSRAIPSAAHL